MLHLSFAFRSSDRPTSAVPTHCSSVARWRFDPPDLDNPGGFKKCLAGKKYFSQTPDFWWISGGFEQVCTGFFLSGRSGGILAVLESPLAKSSFVLTRSNKQKQQINYYLIKNSIFFFKIVKKKK
jgi:hypothetical protein